MAVMISLSKAGAEDWAKQVFAQRATLTVPENLRNAALDMSELPGSATLMLVQRAGVEVMGDLILRLHNGEGAIGWLAKECAKHVADLDGRNADGVAAAIRDIPRATSLPGIDRRFAAARPPIWMDPLTPLSGGLVVADQHVISRPLGFPVAFPTMWEWITQDHESIEQLAHAIDYWRHVYRLVNTHARWLSLQPMVVKQAYHEGQTSFAFEVLLRRWAYVVDELAARIVDNRAHLKDAITEIEVTYQGMKQIHDKLYPELTPAVSKVSATVRDVAETVGDVLDEIPVLDAPREIATRTLDFAAGAATGTRDLAAQLLGLEKMIPLSDRLGDVAKSLHRSYTVGRLAWWGKGPQAQPDIGFDDPKP